MPQKRLTSADHYIYHSVTQRYNIPSQLDSIFISFTHNDFSTFLGTSKLILNGVRGPKSLLHVEYPSDSLEKCWFTY